MTRKSRQKSGYINPLYIPLQYSIFCPRCADLVYFEQGSPYFDGYESLNRDFLWVETKEPHALCFSCGLSFTFEDYCSSLLIKAERTTGMPSYEELGTEIGRLVQTKQEAYGDSFGRSGNVLRVLYPSGIQPDQYDDMLAVVRILDKLFRIATDRDALGESPFRDIAGYGILGAKRSEKPYKGKRKK